MLSRQLKFGKLVFGSRFASAPEELLEHSFAKSSSLQDGLEKLEGIQKQCENLMQMRCSERDTNRKSVTQTAALK